MRYKYIPCKEDDLIFYKTKQKSKKKKGSYFSERKTLKRI